MTKPFIYAALLVIGVVVPTWLAPIAQGGLANLAAFAAWAIGLMILALALIGIFLDSPYESPPKLPKILWWVFFISWWSAVAWAAYHGMYGLAALHTLSSLLISLNKWRKVRQHKGGSNV